MAQARRFCCNQCNHTIEAWDEGDPYYLDAQGEKCYAYHPDPYRNQCIGLDSPHLCLDCGTLFKVDSRAPAFICPSCGSATVKDCWGLQDQPCPFCRQGQFEQDPGFLCIS